MTSNSDIQLLPLHVLAAHCKKQTTRYIQQKSSDPRYCFELFRRAAYNIDGAWEEVDALYRPWLTHKVRLRLSSQQLLLQYEADVEDLVQDTLISFQKYVLNQEKWIKFKNLPAVLSYLDLCTRGVIRDLLRKKDQNRSLSGEGIIDPIDELDLPTETLKTSPEHLRYISELADLIQHIFKHHCHSKQDKAIFELQLSLNIKPKEIAARYPQLFENAADVSSQKRNLVNRIKRDRRIQKMLNSL